MLKHRYTIAIPAYGRTQEYHELLKSIYAMDELPEEILIGEDYSNERIKLAEITQEWKSKFEEKRCIVNWFENPENYGYDKNVRQLIEKATGDWVILIGNDDLFLKNALQEIRTYCDKNPTIAMISRTFIRFEKHINHPLGVSELFAQDTIVHHQKNPLPQMIFRMCGFVGGLIINKKWASTLHTHQFDGSLYYQIYLSAQAYCTQGIGYIATPIVGGRAGNPPMFGNNEDDKEHVPGSYTAKGRAKMWSGVLKIAKYVGNQHHIDLYDPIRQELMVRQAFHVFEMNTKSSKSELKALREELIQLKLYEHWFPKLLYIMNYYFGKNAIIFYKIARKIIQ